MWMTMDDRTFMAETLFLDSNIDGFNLFDPDWTALSRCSGLANQLMPQAPMLTDIAGNSAVLAEMATHITALLSAPGTIRYD
jgi:hypothetical protein